MSEPARCYICDVGFTVGYPEPIRVEHHENGRHTIIGFDSPRQNWRELAVVTVADRDADA